MGWVGDDLGYIEYMVSSMSSSQLATVGETCPWISTARLDFATAVLDITALSSQSVTHLDVII